jgi:hypothetical protein
MVKSLDVFTSIFGIDKMTGMESNSDEKTWGDKKGIIKNNELWRNLISQKYI